MLKVRIKVKDKKFSVPVPYPLLNMFSLIITSKRVNRMINTAINKDGSKFTFPQIDRNDLKPLLQSLSKHKGIVLVDTKLVDGTEVKVRL
ncbi:hypothetical protein J1P26_07875 [Neobacillus sp. MM2021_6]|uniref:hypothetical protein n=2 Tax=Bacillaceae TaxID=186817 RepID=UPI00140D116B|nr:hypothetical protein [Neobacillus sp. MM2021_6]MBO0959638.1 hypothetical protein [Neobacillus sp. MM2021_6]NHC19747.1 hypothetical protein [Bacillus sp. MM2020_4]